VQASALECASTDPSQQGSSDFELASSEALINGGGDTIDSAAHTGKQCTRQLEGVNAVLYAVADLARRVGDMLNPLDEVLSLIRDVVKKVGKFVEKLLASDSVQCFLELTEGPRNVFGLVTCPADELLNAFQYVHDKLLDQFIELINDLAENLISEVVDVLVPDELDFTIPNFLGKLPAPPSDLWLQGCTARKVDAALGLVSAATDQAFEAAGISEYHHYLNTGVDALKSLPYRVTAAVIEQSIADELTEQILFDRSMEQSKFQSVCNDAWNELKATDVKFQTCKDLGTAIGTAILREVTPIGSFSRSF